MNRQPDPTFGEPDFKTRIIGGGGEIEYFKMGKLMLQPLRFQEGTENRIRWQRAEVLKLKVTIRYSPSNATKSILCPRSVARLISSFSSV